MGRSMRALRNFGHWVKAFARSQRGNTSMIFGITCITVLSAGGAGIDFARAVQVKGRMAEALDAAALAVGNTSGLTQAQMREMAQSYFDANYSSTAGTANPVQLSQDGDSIDLSVTGAMPTTLLQLAGIDTVNLSVSNAVSRGAVNIEVGLALDITGSMSGSKITDLKAAAKDLIDLVVQDAQTPFYSKVALAPYSMGVNLGNYANSVRGPVIGAKSMSNAIWVAGTAKTITAATRADPARITLNNIDGLDNGDFIYISGVGGMTQLNNKIYKLANKNTTNMTFTLQTVSGSNVNSNNYSTFSTSGTPRARECFTSTCEVRVTSNNHGFSNGDYVYITGVSGMTSLNNNAFQVKNAATNTFILSHTQGYSYNAYSSGGSIWCTEEGCEYHRFTSATGSTRVFRISNCVSERTGLVKFSDTAPSTFYVGRNYPASNNPCPNISVTPLSSNRTSLKSTIDSYAIGGSTAGHLGLAWAWYMVSPNFGYLWPNAVNRPATYETERVRKIVVLMTDGAFNTTYCNGVISQDSLSGSGNDSDHINCNAPNGTAFAQAASLCTSIKAAGIIIYTVGFDVGNNTSVQNFMRDCASTTSNYYLASDGAALRAAFVAIAQDINSLRLTQ